MTSRSLLATAAALMLGLPASAQPPVVLYTNNFDIDTTALWRANPTANNPSGSVADFFFNYSTVGIPVAPNSVGGTTRGLKIEANVFGGAGVVSGISVSPTVSPIPAGLTSYTLRFDAWQNFNGPFPGGGTGSTQHTGAGFGTDGTTSQFPGAGTVTGSVQGVTFATDGDGGSAATSATPDYMAYKVAGTVLATGFAATGATPRDNADPYYAGFGNVAAPATQLAAFPQQTGNTAVGTLGMAWHTWDITRTDNTVTWSVDNRLIATVDVSDKPFAGTNFFLGQFDYFASVVPLADRPLVFGLIDNVSVTTPVPEPAFALTAIALAAPLLWVRRRLNRRRAGR